MKNPYNFGLKSRRDIIDFLTEGGRHYYDRHGSYPLSWNIKVYRYDETGNNNGNPDYAIDPALNDAWEAHLEEKANYCSGETYGSQYFWRACEEGLSYFFDCDVTVYPGDVVDCKFYALGRMGGHLCLAEWEGHDLARMGKDDFQEFLENLDYQRLRQLYRFVVCLDKDINPERELSYNFNFLRSEWESEYKEEQALKFPYALPENYREGAAI